MNEKRRREYTEKYIRTGKDVIVPKGDNPYPQMKADSFRLDVTHDFGGYGGSVLWASIFEPVNMQPEPAVSEQPRHITVIGGGPLDFTKLHGEAVVTIGRNKDDKSTFTLTEPFSVYVEKGMLYSINITKVNPGCPVRYSELIVGDGAPVTDAQASGGVGYEKYIKTGGDIVANYPDKDNLPCPVMTISNPMFGSKELIRRTWMPITKPHVMAKNSHTHAFEEFLVCYGSDPDNISDLGGVIEFTIGEDEDSLETFRIDKAVQFYVKDGLWHCPLVFKEVYDENKPMIFCEVSYAAVLAQDKALDNFIVEEDPSDRLKWVMPDDKK